MLDNVQLEPEHLARRLCTSCFSLPTILYRTVLSSINLECTLNHRRVILLRYSCGCRLTVQSRVNKKRDVLCREKNHRKTNVILKNKYTRSKYNSYYNLTSRDESMIILYSYNNIREVGSTYTVVRKTNIIPWICSLLIHGKICIHNLRSGASTKTSCVAVYKSCDLLSHTTTSYIRESLKQAVIDA